LIWNFFSRIEYKAKQIHFHRCCMTKKLSNFIHDYIPKLTNSPFLSNHKSAEWRHNHHIWRLCPIFSSTKLKAQYGWGIWRNSKYPGATLIALTQYSHSLGICGLNCMCWMSLSFDWKSKWKFHQIFYYSAFLNIKNN
jgi:hypothetical protein